MKVESNRFRNYGLWVSILALAPMLLRIFGISVIPAEYKEVTSVILLVLVGLGIINDPTTQYKGYRDDKVKVNEAKAKE